MLNLVVRTLILYGTVIAALRIMGKRQLGELQPSELVVTIMISDLVSVPMQAIEIPLFSGIIPAITLIAAEVFLSYLSLKSRRIRNFLSGEPSMVIYNGHINEKELARLRFNINDLLEELRVNGYHDISDVSVAVIETSGKLSIIPSDTSRTVTVEDMRIKNPKCDGLPFTLITDGELNSSELKRSGKDESWLEAELKKRNISDIKNIFIASLNSSGDFYIQMKEENK